MQKFVQNNKTLSEEQNAKYQTFLIFTRPSVSITKVWSLIYKSQKQCLTLIPLKILLERLNNSLETFFGKPIKHLKRLVSHVCQPLSMDSTTRKSVAKPQCKPALITLEVLLRSWRCVTRFEELKTIFAMVHQNYKIEAYPEPTPRVRTQYSVVLNKHASSSNIKSSLIPRRLQHLVRPPGTI